jgi:LysM repeat protein
MSRRVLVGFVIVNVIVSFAVAFIFVKSYDRFWRPKVEPIEGPTQIVILTATSIPGSENVIKPGEYQSTIDAQQGTLNALANVTPVAVVPTDASGQTEALTVPDVATVATIDPALLPPIPSDLPTGQPSATAEDDGCIRHTVESGDVILSIADQYGVFPGDILTANGLTEDSILQIGDVLIIPTEGCAALYTPTPEPTATNTPFELITIAAPTVTLAPTAINAQVSITNVLSWNDVNNESVELRNEGDALNLQGWTLSDEDDDSFLFPEFRMQPGSVVRVFTRQGPNTPAALFWGRDTAAWEEGDILTLMDDTGQVQATFRVGAAADSESEEDAAEDTATPQATLSEG